MFNVLHPAFILWCAVSAFSVSVTTAFGQAIVAPKQNELVPVLGDYIVNQLSISSPAIEQKSVVIEKENGLDWIITKVVKYDSVSDSFYKEQRKCSYVGGGLDSNLANSNLISAQYFTKNDAYLYNDKKGWTKVDGIKRDMSPTGLFGGHASVFLRGISAPLLDQRLAGFAKTLEKDFEGVISNKKDVGLRADRLGRAVAILDALKVRPLNLSEVVLLPSMKYPVSDARTVVTFMEKPLDKVIQSIECYKGDTLISYIRNSFADVSDIPPPPSVFNKILATGIVAPKPKNGVFKKKIDEKAVGLFFKRQEKGIFVIDVVKDSVASKLGLKAGDVITEISGVDPSKMPLEILQQFLRTPGSVIKKQNMNK